MELWGFIFCLAAAILLAVEALVGRSLTAAALALFVIGFICTFAMSGATVHL